MFGPTAGGSAGWQPFPKRRDPKRLLPWGLGVVGVLLVIGFFIWLLTRPPQGEEQLAVCSLVIDQTGSAAADPAARERFRSLAERTVDGCRQRQATLSVSSFAQGGPKLVIHSDPSYRLYQQPARNVGPAIAALEDTMEAAMVDVAELIQPVENPSRRSDILAAVDIAAENLQSEAATNGVDERYLVVLTDGIQLAPEISVADLDNEDASVQPLVDRALELQLVPDLTGVDVSFVGVRSGATTEGEALPAWFELKVEEFWRQIIELGGGSLCVYRPDTTDLPGGC